MDFKSYWDLRFCSYVEYRKWCNLSPVEEWDDLRNIMSDEIIDKLKDLYGHPGLNFFDITKSTWQVRSNAFPFEYLFSKISTKFGSKYLSLLKWQRPGGAAEVYTLAAIGKPQICAAFFPPKVERYKSSHPDWISRGQCWQIVQNSMSWNGLDVFTLKRASSVVGFSKTTLQETSTCFRVALWRKDSTEHWLVRPFHVLLLSSSDVYATVIDSGSFTLWIFFKHLHPRWFFKRTWPTYSLLNHKTWVHRYEKESVFTAAQKNEIEKASLARIICDNADNIGRIQVKAPAALLLLFYFRKTLTLEILPLSCLTACSYFPLIISPSWFWRTTMEKVVKTVKVWSFHDYSFLLV